MSDTPIVLRSFGGGLNLVDSAPTVDFAYALDTLNVTFTRRGALGTRGGYAALRDTALTNQPDSLHVFKKTDGTRVLVTGNGNGIDVIGTDGDIDASTTSPTASPHFFTTFGGPTLEAVYISNGTDQVRRYDAAGGFTSPVGLSGQTGKFLCVTPESNRLMVARESGSTAGNNPSSVTFSNPGLPETFSSTDYIQLGPGDGEAIMGMIAVQDYVLIFKETKAWLFYGEGTDSTGGAVFNTRKFSHNVGLVASRAIAASEDTVYWLGEDGVYRTAGGSPECVSDNIEPFFSGATNLYFRSQPINWAHIDKAAMCFHDRRLYLAVPTGSSTTNDRMLVYDPQVGWWTLYDIAAAAMVSCKVEDEKELVFARSGGQKKVYRHKTGQVPYFADGMTSGGTGGSAITWRWRSGWWSGSPNEQRIHNAALTATGHAVVRNYVDFDFTDSLTNMAQTIRFTEEDSTWGGGGWDAMLWGPTVTPTTKTYQRGFGGSAVSLDFQNTTIDPAVDDGSLWGAAGWDDDPWPYISATPVPPPFELHIVNLFLSGERLPGVRSSRRPR